MTSLRPHSPSPDDDAPASAPGASRQAHTGQASTHDEGAVEHAAMTNGPGDATRGASGDPLSGSVDSHSDGHGAHDHAGHGDAAQDHAGQGHGGHGHGGHGHGVSAGNAPFGIAVGLNTVFVVIEVGVGLAIGSTALVADAAHNLGDVLGLLLAWGAARLARRRPSATRSYGFRKSTVLASLGNAVVLLLFLGAVIWEAAHHLAEPRPIAGSVVSLVAGVGVLINFGSALLFVRQARTDLNAKGAYLHLIADALVSVAVLVAGGILALAPTWYWIDPLVSIGVSLLVLRGAWTLLREALHLTLDGVPEHVDLEQVRKALLELPGVVAVADLHVWAISTSEAALTAHLAVSSPTPELAQRAGNLVKERFGIGHSTVQLDDSGTPCVHC